MLILYAYEANTILVEPIISQSDLVILRAYDVLYKKMESAGHAQKLNTMDN